MKTGQIKVTLTFWEQYVLFLIVGIFIIFIDHALYKIFNVTKLCNIVQMFKLVLEKAEESVILLAANDRNSVETK